MDAWTVKCKTALSRADDTLALIIDRDRARKLQLDTTTKDSQMGTQIQELKRARQVLERELSQLEQQVDQTTGKSVSVEGKDELLVRLAKQIDLIESRSGLPSTTTSTVDTTSSPSRPSNSPLKRTGSSQSRPIPLLEQAGISEDEATPELLQIAQEDMIQRQDSQLDQLASVISRQKQIGLTISDELDLQADLLERMDERVERTNGGMRGARDRLEAVFEQGKGNKTTCIMVVLILVLILLIVLTK